MRAAALQTVGDFDEAQRVLEAGIAVARQRGLGYELGLMLAAAATFPVPVDTGSDEPPAMESDRLLKELGVDPSPAAS